MIQICKNDKEKVFEAIRSEQINTAEFSFPKLINDIVFTMKHQGLTGLFSFALPDKRRDNKYILFDILLCLAVIARLKRKNSLTDVMSLLQSQRRNCCQNLAGIYGITKRM